MGRELPVPIDIFAEAARKVASGAVSAGEALVDNPVTDYVSQAYKQATAGLDKPGPDFSPQPFSAGEIPDTTSGIARVLTNMMAARRDVANYKAAQATKEAQKAKQDLELQRLTQQVAAGKTTPYEIDGKSYDLNPAQAATIAARRAGKSGSGGAGEIGGKNVPITVEHLGRILPKGSKSASFVVDPNDATRGVINEKELASLEHEQTFTATEQNRETTASLVQRRLDLTTAQAGINRELKTLDDEETAASESAKAAAQAQVQKDLAILNADHMEGKTSVQFEQERTKIARKYGLSASVGSAGDVQTVDSEYYLQNEKPQVRGGGLFGIGAKRPSLRVYDMSDVSNQRQINLFIDAAGTAAADRHRNDPGVVSRRKQLRDANDANLMQQNILQVAIENNVAVNPQPGNNGPRGSQFAGSTPSAQQAAPKPNSPAPAAPVEGGAAATSSAAPAPATTGAGRQVAATGQAAPMSAEEEATRRLAAGWFQQDSTRTANKSKPKPVKPKR